MPLLTLFATIFVSSPAGAAADAECGEWSAVERVGYLENDDLIELSGLASSRVWPRLLWAHNDSGDPWLYAIDTDGRGADRVELSGLQVQNWEDLALGPCLAPTTSCSCLYLGDIGSEQGGRDLGVVYRFPEPDAADTVVSDIEALPFSYPDGWHDAEALLVHPLTGELLILTRSEDRTDVYAFPTAPPDPAQGVAVLDRVGSFDLAAWGAEDPRVGAADWSPLGERVFVRTNSDLFVFTDLWSDPERLPAPARADHAGEAIAVDPDGDSLTLAGEGQGADVWRVHCAAYPAQVADSDPLVDCELPEDSGCGCGGGVGGAWVLMPLLGWRRRRRALRARR